MATSEPRTSNQKITALLDDYLPRMRAELRTLTGAERAVGAAVGMAVPFMEPRVRAELLTRPPAAIDALLERVAALILSLRSDGAADTGGYHAIWPLPPQAALTSGEATP